MGWPHTLQHTQAEIGDKACVYGYLDLKYDALSGRRSCARGMLTNRGPRRLFLYLGLLSVLFHGLQEGSDELCEPVSNHIR